VKILLSAYACEPNHGSEPGVGWNWAIELTRLGYDVWVLTRESNQKSIEAVVRNNESLQKINFLYYDLPKWFSWWKKGGRGIRLYYFFWQIGAYHLAKDIHSVEKFEIVHHVTFVSIRQPSFMGGLGIPFIFGPVGGGEKAPWTLRLSYGVRGILLDGIRGLANWFVKLDPFMWHTFRNAKTIYVTSEQTRNLIPKKFRKKSHVQLAIGWEGNTLDSDKSNKKNKSLRVLYVGRFLYWKGICLGLEAFAALLKQIPEAKLTLVGQGPDKKRLKQHAVKIGLVDKIEWVPWMNQDDLVDMYQQSDIFLFPSLHDSGGMVVLEAMSYGLPVVCFNLGGPGVMVDDSCGVVVDVTGCSGRKVVEKLEKALQSIAQDPYYRTALSTGALEKATTLSWANVVKSIYNNYKI